MSKEVKDVRKAIRDLQIERRKIDQAIELVYTVSSLVSSESEFSKSKKRSLSYVDASKVMSRVEKAMKEMFNQIKKLIKVQNYPTKDLIRAVEKLDKSANSTALILRQDIKIQEHIELRTKSLNRLFDRLMVYLQVQRKSLEEGMENVMTSDLKSNSYWVYIDDYLASLLPLITYIRDELRAEKNTIDEEIKGLSEEIEKLE